MRTWLILVLLLGAMASCSPSTEEPEASRFDLPDGAVLTSLEVREYRDYVDEADAAYGMNDAASCAANYREALEIYGGNEGHRYDLACCLALSGNVDEALEELDAAIDLGFAYADHMRKDEDLHSLRDRSEFQALLERAESASMAAKQRDGMAGEAEPGGAFATLADLELFFEERERERSESLGEAGRILGRTLHLEVDRRADRDRIVALQTFAGKHPDQAAEAGLLALQGMAELRPPALALADEVAAYLDRHGADPRAAAARMIAAAGLWDGRTLEDPEHESHAEAISAIAEVASSVVADQGDSSFSRDAHYWLLRQATLVGDRDRMRELYGEIRRRWSEEEEFWDREGYHLFAARLEHDGLEPFEVESIAGESLSLEAFRGRVTLIDFWATWCGPCIQELPRLKEIHATYHDQGFEIVGINADEETELDLAAFREWLRSEDLPWPQFYDGKGWQNEILQLYGVTGLPTTILLDRDGGVVGVDLGTDRLEAVLKEIL